MKNENKLFVVVERGYIVAITEDKKTAKRFIKERSRVDLDYVRVNKRKDIDKIIIDNDDKFITEEPLLNILITEAESKYFLEEVYNEIYRLKSVMRDLEYIRKKYDLPEDIDKHIKKGIEGLVKITKPKIFGEVFGLEVLTRALTSNNKLLERYVENDK